MKNYRFDIKNCKVIVIVILGSRSVGDIVLL
jgi:hypothetical protein